jgi:hypothetical protein
MEKVPLDFALGVTFGVLIPGLIRLRRERLPVLQAPTGFFPLTSGRGVNLARPL